jgi:hypothetical protein
LESTNLGWAAGIFEGEGNANVFRVRISVFNKTEGKRVQYVANHPMITVTNTDISILARFRVIVGKGTVRTAKKANERQKQLFHYRVEGRKALFVARLLHPFIVSDRKRKQLESILDYYSQLVFNPKGSQSSKRVWASYTPEQRRLRALAISEGRRRGARGLKDKETS